ncbi:MAG: MFS transporter, partial [Chloroflexi bacterium]|nr:MFS transporter [Chloroflexota bacterium]
RLSVAGVTQIEVGSGPLAPLRVHDFRLLLLMQFVTGFRQPLQFFAQAWYVNSVAPEGQRVLLLGLLATLQGVAYLSYILFGGALADRYPRRTTLLITHGAAFLALLLTGSLLLLPGASTGDGLWLWIMMLVFTEFALVIAQDFPARMAMVTDVVPEELRTTAVTLHWLVFSLAFLVAAPTVGWLLDEVGFAATYFVASIGHVLVILLLRKLNHPAAAADPDAAGQTMLDNVRGGIAYLGEAPGVRWVVIVTWLSLSAGIVTMGLLVAAWIDQVLGLSASGWGLMALFWGIGGVLASTSLAVAGEYRHKGPLFIATVGGFGLSVLGFSLTRSVVVATLFFLLTGASFQLLITLGNAIVQDAVPSRLLARVMGMLWMAQGIAQASGVLMGALAQSLGLTVFYPAVGVFMIAVAIYAALQRPLRQTG